MKFASGTRTYTEAERNAAEAPRREANERDGKRRRSTRSGDNYKRPFDKGLWRRQKRACGEGDDIDER